MCRYPGWLTDFHTRSRGLSTQQNEIKHMVLINVFYYWVLDARKLEFKSSVQWSKSLMIPTCLPCVNTMQQWQTSLDQTAHTWGKTCSSRRKKENDTGRYQRIHQWWWEKGEEKINRWAERILVNQQSVKHMYEQMSNETYNFPLTTWSLDIRVV